MQKFITDTDFSMFEEMMDEHLAEGAKVIHLGSRKEKAVKDHTFKSSKKTNNHIRWWAVVELAGTGIEGI